MTSLVYRAVFSLFIGAFVLQALWRNDQSARCFEERLRHNHSRPA